MMVLKLSDKRFQVFISSTYEDLKDERDAIIRGLLDVDCFPAGMEMFVASDESQWEMIKKYIDQSDYYLVVSAGRYGSIDEETGFSFTEKEYRYAIETDTPVAAFIRDNIDELPQKSCEQSADLKQRLFGFHNLLQSGRVVSKWSNKDELRNQVTLSINRLSREREAIGWVRANTAPPERILQELLDAKNELLELNRKLQNYEQKSQSINQNFAWYNDEVTLSGFLSNANDELIAEFVFEYQWNTLFQAIATCLTSGESVHKWKISKSVCTLVFASEKTYRYADGKPRLHITATRGHTKTEAREQIHTATLFSNSEHLMLSQCVVHNLIEIDGNDLVRLTDFGRQHLYELSAIPVSAD